MKALVPVLAAVLTTSLAAEEEVARSVGADIMEETTRIIVKYKEGIVASQGVEGPGGTRIFRVDTREAEAFAGRLRFRPEVAEVAVDVIVRNPPLPQASFTVTEEMRATGAVPSGTPTDPGFERQVSWQAPTDLNRGVQNILAGYRASERNQSVRVGVLDSGFYPVSDLDYAAGYNLSLLDGYGPEFLENEVNPTCTDPHGTAVAGIIAATANNGVGIAGILDAEVVAARVLSCGTGVLSDTALGIRWLAGDPSVTEAPALDQPVNIINASLGSDVPNCPFYLQEAIDYAHDKGILVVVAAGNDSRDASEFTPANCNNVLTVGSVNQQGESSDFSNFGDAVDILALGELVASVNMEGEVSRWFGTSFAAPLVAGSAGLLQQVNPSLTPAELRNSLVATARVDQTEASAVGVADAGKSVANVMAQLQDLRPVLRPALEAIERCNRQAYLANAPSGVDYSKMYELTVAQTALLAENEHYTVFRTTETDVKTRLTHTQEKRFVIKDINPDTEQLWFDICDAEGENCRYDRNLPI